MELRSRGSLRAVPKWCLHVESCVEMYCYRPSAEYDADPLRKLFREVTGRATRHGRVVCVVGGAMAGGGVVSKLVVRAAVAASLLLVTQVSAQDAPAEGPLDDVDTGEGPLDEPT